jgi:hypothetical protein
MRSCFNTMRDFSVSSRRISALTHSGSAQAGSENANANANANTNLTTVSPEILNQTFTRLENKGAMSVLISGDGWFVAGGWGAADERKLLGKRRH